MTESNIRTRAERRRISLLEKACMIVSAQVNNGMSVDVALRKVAKRFNGRALGDGRPLCCSPDTLCRLWYAWRKANRDSSVFTRKWNPLSRLSKVDQASIALIVNAALSVGVRIGTAFEKLGGEKKIVCSVDTIYRRAGRRMVELARENHRISRMKSILFSEFINGAATPYTTRRPAT